MTIGRGYTQIETNGAHNFALAAERAGVEQIIYLGGLADPNDKHIGIHLRSRMETGEMLRRGKVPVSEFRAGVIAGSGSISFEMIRFMTEALPLIIGPTWLRNQAQPIATENVIDYLMVALENFDKQSRVLEIGGNEIITYARFNVAICPHPWLEAQADHVAWHPALVHGNRHGADDAGSASELLMHSSADSPATALFNTMRRGKSFQTSN